MNDTNLQPFIFMLTVYSGLLSGLIYDFYRILRRLIKLKWLWILFDTLFVLSFAGIVALTLYLSGSGVLRLYNFAGISLGFGLYLAGISPLFRYICKKIKDKRSKRSLK